MCRILGVTNPLCVGEELGVEMEVEEVRNISQLERVGGIEIKRDGSLRGERAFEFVSARHMPVDRTMDVWRELMHTLHSSAPPLLSKRCSTHVHINIMDLSHVEFVRLCAVYAALEPWFVAAAGSARAGNHFCLPWSVAPHNLRTVVALTKMKGDLMPLIRDRLASGNKYSALNTLSATRIGTVEFRMGEAFDSFPKLQKWINAVVSVRRAALSYATLGDVIRIAMEDPYAMAQQVFGGLDMPAPKDVSGTYLNMSAFITTKVPRRRRPPVWFEEVPPAAQQIGTEITDDFVQGVRAVPLERNDFAEVVEDPQFLSSAVMIERLRERVRNAGGVDTEEGRRLVREWNLRRTAVPTPTVTTTAPDEPFLVTTNTMSNSFTRRR